MKFSAKPRLALALGLTPLLLASSALAQGTFIYDQQSSTNESSLPPDYPLWITENQPIGQSFTPALSSVGFVRLYTGDVRGLGETLYVNLRGDSITGAVLSASGPLVLAANFHGFVNFFFPSDVTVTPGNTYYLQPVVQSGNGYMFVDFKYNYNGGTAFINGGVLPRYDFWFREGVFIPEPSAACLIALAAVALRFCARRHKSKTNENTRFLEAIFATCALLSLTVVTAAAQSSFIYDQQSSTNEIALPYGSGVTIQQLAPYGQSFTPNLNSIDFVRLKLNDNNPTNGIGATLSVNIRTNSLTGSLLGVSAPVVLTNGFRGVVDFLLTGTVQLVPGATYFIESVIQPSSDLWNIEATEYNYPGGTAFYFGNRSLPGSDVWFREGTFVPEPSFASLVVIGAITLRIYARRRPRKTDENTPNS